MDRRVLRDALPRPAACPGCRPVADIVDGQGHPVFPAPFGAWVPVHVTAGEVTAPHLPA